MKLNENIIVTKIEDGYILINSLNGLADNINEETLSILQKWKGHDEILPNSDIEFKLYDKLNSRGYLSHSILEETKKKEQIISELRNKQKTLVKKTNNLAIVMTYNCNFRCPYCFENIGNKLKNSYMSETMIDAALKMTGDSLNRITLFGGEPLLIRNRKVIEYLIKKAPEKEYCIITNGYNLDKFIDVFKTIKVEYIMVTLDGNEDTHNKKRLLYNNNKTYEKILQNIEIALKNNIPIRIRMNLDEDNYKECIKLRENLSEMFKTYNGLLSYELSPLMGIEYGIRNTLFKELLIDDSRYSDNNEKSYNNIILSKFSPIINKFIGSNVLVPKYSFCHAHDNGLVVDPFGYIYPCFVSVGQKKFAVGKYYPQMELFKDSIKERNIETIEKCRNCSYSLLCGGGCPIMLGNTDDIFQPECFSINNQIYNLLPMLIKTNKDELKEF